MKTKRPTIDAQQLKKALIEASKRIGKRKKLTAGEAFELVVSCRGK